MEEKVTICPHCQRELKTDYEMTILKECLVCRYTNSLNIEQYHAMTRSILTSIYETISAKYTKIDNGAVAVADVDPKTAYIDCIGMIVNLLDVLSQTSDKISILSGETQLIFDEIYHTTNMEKTNNTLEALKRFQEEQKDKE